MVFLTGICKEARALFKDLLRDSVDNKERVIYLEHDVYNVSAVLLVGHQQKVDVMLAAAEFCVEMLICTICVCLTWPALFPVPAHVSGLLNSGV